MGIDEAQIECFATAYTMLHIVAIYHIISYRKITN